MKFLAIALVAGAVAYSPQGGTARGAAGGPRPSTPILSAARSARTDQLICQYLGEVGAAGTCTIPYADLDMQFLIGLVPDPVDSDARWMFDSSLDAIHSAVTQQGFTLFRASFPDWQPNADQPPPADDLGVARHEREPAVILFHQEPAPLAGAAPSRQLLIVFLAYETSTGGVHAAALNEALRFQRDWEARAGGEARCNAPVRIVGPTFSGSSAGLRHVIDRFHEGDKDTCPGGKPFRIITGSATSLFNRAQLTMPGTTFQSAVLSDKAILPPLFDFVRSRFWKTPSMAALIESTPYGDALSAGGVTRYRFPLHISRLRSRNIATGPGDAARTPLTLADQMEPTDRLPVITPGTTAPTVDLMLDGIFDQMRRQRVDAVGLFATDTRDKLFLAEQIARAVPGVLLFTTEVDVLYSHPQFSTAVRGMIVASSYPPVPSDMSRGSDGALSRYMFPGSLALGTFNAAVSLLASSPDLLEYGSQTDSDASPPVWLSLVAGGGIWPVERQKARQGGDAPYSQLRDSRPREPRDSEASVWIWVATVVLALLALCHLLAQLSVLSTKKESRKRFAGLLDFIVDAERSHAGYLLVSEAALLAELLLFAGAWSTGLRHLEERVALSVLGFAACCVLASMALSRPSFGTSGAARPAQRYLRMAVSGVGLLLGASLVGFLVLHMRQVLESWTDQDAQMLFFDRAMHPAGGSSPLVVMGIVVAPIYLWGLFQVSASGRTPMRKLAAVVRSLAAGHTGAKDRWLAAFLGSIERPFTKLPAVSACLILAAVSLAGLLFLASPAASVEPWPFTAAFVAAWLVVQLLLSISLLQALRVWSLLRSLLQALGAHPMAVTKAYLQVPSQMLGDRLSPRRPRVMTLGALVNLRRRLLTPLPVSAEPPGQLRHAIDVAIAELGTTAFDFDQDVASPRWRWRGWTTTPTFEACARDAVVVQRALAGAWWRQTASVPAGDKLSGGWCRRSEVFLGMFVALFVRETLSRLANTLFLMVLTVLLLVATQVMFTFHPRQMFLGLTWVYALVTVGVTMYVFVSLERNRVMSMLASTEDGTIQWDRSFWTKMLLYAIVPLATLFAAQFPQVGETLGRWVGTVQPLAP